MAHLEKKCTKGDLAWQGLNWITYKRKLLNLLFDSDSWWWDLKVNCFPLQHDIPGTLEIMGKYNGFL